MFNLGIYKNIFLNGRKLKFSLLIFLLIPIFGQKEILSDLSKNKYKIEQNKTEWKRIEHGETQEIIWQKIKTNKDNKILSIKKNLKIKELPKNKNVGISSFNRSIVFDNSIVGPDIFWLIPPGFKWSNKYKFYTSKRHRDKRKR